MVAEGERNVVAERDKYGGRHRDGGSEEEETVVDERCRSLLKTNKIVHLHKTNKQHYTTLHIIVRFYEPFSTTSFLVGI